MPGTLPSGPKPGLTGDGSIQLIAPTVRDSVQPPKVVLESDDPRNFEAAFRLVSRSAFLLARQLGRSTEELMDRYRIQLGDALTADDLQRWIVVP